jgi:hypothetical protein
MSLWAAMDLQRYEKTIRSLPCVPHDLEYRKPENLIMMIIITSGELVALNHQPNRRMKMTTVGDLLRDHDQQTNSRPSKR